MDGLSRLLSRPEFPRSNQYDRDYMLDNQMGPNALWLVEWLSEALPWTPGMRVLDLGCGRCMSSIFLAKEFSVQVWAADLWMSPDNNWRRVLEAGVADRVCPLRAEAHALPFAAGFFDAIVSIDAYQYFGTDELYLNYLSGFVRTGGLIGVVVPGLMQPIDDTVPPHLTARQSNGKSFWEDECYSFRTRDSWGALWRRSSRVTDVRVDAQADGWQHWRDFERALEMAGKSIFPSDAETLDRDGGNYLGFLRLVARRTAVSGMSLYDPSLGVSVGVDR